MRSWSWWLRLSLLTWRSYVARCPLVWLPVDPHGDLIMTSGCLWSLLFVIAALHAVRSQSKLLGARRQHPWPLQWRWCGIGVSAPGILAAWHNADIETDDFQLTGFQPRQEDKIEVPKISWEEKVELAAMTFHPSYDKSKENVMKKVAILTIGESWKPARSTGQARTKATPITFRMSSTCREYHKATRVSLLLIERLLHRWWNLPTEQTHGNSYAKWTLQNWKETIMHEL